MLTGPKSSLVIVAATLALALPLTGCGNSKEASESRSASAKMTDAKAIAPAVNRAMRITIDVQLASGDVDESAEALRSATSATGGYVSDSRTSGSADNRTADLELKIPVEKLEEMRGKISESGSIVQESQKAEDVTDQKTDLEARLRNARAQEKRLLDLLSDRTGTLSDVIAAEKALADVRETIERLDAQNATLAGQIAYATVHVRIGVQKPAAPATFLGRVGSAANDGISGLGKACVAIIVVLLTVTPTLLLLLALGYSVFWISRAIVRRMGKAPVNPIAERVRPTSAR